MSELDYLGGLGWLPTPLHKLPKQADVYGFQLFIPFVAKSVEVEFVLPAGFSAKYNQGNHGSCTAAASCQLQAAMNLAQHGEEHYDIWPTYCKICLEDDDPSTSCQADLGSYLYAAWDVSLKYGACVKNVGWLPDRGIASYRWIRGSGVVDQARTAHGEGLLTNDGVPWFSNWTAANLEQKDGRWWLPKRAKWGRVAGGHSIGKYGALDSLQAFVWNNTWGSAFPKVCVPYKDWEYLITQVGGECAAVVDKVYQPPEPPQPPATHSVTATVKINGTVYELVQR